MDLPPAIWQQCHKGKAMADGTDKVVKFRVRDEVAIVTLSSPPVNALSAKVRTQLLDVFERIEQHPRARAVVLQADFNAFSAGIDLKEFDQPTAGAPSLAEICQAVENCSYPVVASVQGQALGAGAELAIAAHWRFGTKGTIFGLPEITLGLLPSAGGTQRLARLIGASDTLTLLLSGRPAKAPALYKAGLFDGLVDGDLPSAALTYAEKLIADGTGPRKTADRREKLTDTGAWMTAVTSAREVAREMDIPAAEYAVDCVEAALLLPFEAGVAMEEDAFARALMTPESKALRHVFLAERRASKGLLDRAPGGVWTPTPEARHNVLGRLQGAIVAADRALRAQGISEAALDGCLLAYGFETGIHGHTEPKPDPALVRKLLAALVAEGGRLLDEGVVTQARDLDVVSVHGLGYPRMRGGMMKAAELDGLLHLTRDMEGWAIEDPVWTPSQKLEQAALIAGGFAAV